jgi:hypothetical protein
MPGIQSLNANAEVMGRQAALFMNINAAKGLEDVMKTNLGPKGTIKMLVTGAGGARMMPFSFAHRLHEMLDMVLPTTRVIGGFDVMLPSRIHPTSY